MNSKEKIGLVKNLILKWAVFYNKQFNILFLNEAVD